jgi:hypothetical protein
LLELTGDDILVHRGAARGRDERAASVGMRARARREAMLARTQLPERDVGKELVNCNTEAARALFEIEKVEEEKNLPQKVE